MLLSRWLMLSCALIPAGALATPTEQVRALHQEVVALQLDHTLDLTRPQAQALLPLLQDARAQVQAWRAQRDAAQPALAAALSQAAADLKASGAVSPSTQQAVQAARAGPNPTARQKAKALWQQARQILTASQLQALHSARLGLGRPMPPDGDAGWSRHGRGCGRFARHQGRHQSLAPVLLSDAFVSLVRARAG